MSALDPETSIAGLVQTGSAATLAGKSHSWDRPTWNCPSPRACTISVALDISGRTRSSCTASLYVRSARPQSPQPGPEHRPTDARLTDLHALRMVILSSNLA